MGVDGLPSWPACHPPRNASSLLVDDALRLWTLDARDARLHIGTLNVCGLPSALPPLTRRAAELCRHIDASDLDLVNFQEVWSRRSFEAIRPRLPSYGYVAWRRATGGRPAGGLVTFSRYPIGAVRYTSYRGVRPMRAPCDSG